VDVPALAAHAKGPPEICVDQPGFDRVAFHKNFNAKVLRLSRPIWPIVKPARPELPTAGCGLSMQRFGLNKQLRPVAIADGFFDNRVLSTNR
jgi:hypothetical protein